MRQRFTNGMIALSGSDKFAYVGQQYGMFSLLPLDADQLEELKSRYSVYLIPGGRINVAGLTDRNLDHVIRGIHAVTS